MIAGPELCRVVEEFEGVQNKLDELPHHEEGLVSLGDKICESPVSAHSVYVIESTGKEQFKTYQEIILH